jgi:two-component system phosphate regulon response regulator OmpR
MNGKTCLLIVDDDPDVQSTVREYFEMQGFAVSVAGDGAAMRQVLATEPIEVVLMDLHLPGEDGLALTRELRAKGGIGIVVVTGLGETVDRIVGLEMGADDYVAKPFDLRELLARVKSVLRRVRTGGVPRAATPTQAMEKIRMGRCTLDVASRKLYDPNGEEIAMTSMEFDLLVAFAKNPNRVLSRDRLLELAHTHGEEVFDRSIDVRIARIRKKIEVNAERPEVLKTVRGVGYMFVPESAS